MSEEGYEEANVKEAFETNWISPIGPQVNAFEAEFSQYIGVKHAAALSSGTAALHLAMILLEVKPGDKVFCSDFTFAASVNPIVYQGAEPVFIDSDSRTWNMDSELLAAELKRCAKSNSLPKAVIAVDICGQSADYEPIVRACRNYEVPLIEDAAEALGAEYRGLKTGNFGEIGVFSFNGNKIITTSGGGMLVSNDEDFVKRTKFLSTQARDPVPHYQHSHIGYNYRMSNVLAGIGRGQLKVLDERVMKRRWIFEQYKESLSELPGIEFMPEPEGYFSTRWLSCILVDEDAFGASREDIRLKLEEYNIESRALWMPMHLQPVFEGCRCVGGAVSENLFRKGLCLPSGTRMTRNEIDMVCDLLRSTSKAL